MSNPGGTGFFTLLQREFREYKNSLFWTPIVTAILLTLLMLVSVTLVNQFSFLGDFVLKRMIEQDGSGNFSVSLSINEEGDSETTVVEIEDLTDPDGDSLRIDTGRDLSEMGVEVPPPPPEPQYEVFVEKEVNEEAWNFSREWSFNPESARGNGGADGDEDFAPVEMEGRELNVVFSVLHGIFLLILVLTSANYLLSSLFDDRKDRSILFFRSMPIAERDVVLSKLAMAIIVAPVIYIAASILLQLSYVLLMMLLVWRMDESPFDVVLSNIDFQALLLDPISGWVLTALLIAPAYAWLLLASAAARRSPFLMAVTPIIALLIAEGVFLGSDHVGGALARHVPHLSDTSAVGFYLFGPDWTRLDLLSLASGLLFAAAALAGAVWLRQHRWEL